MSATRLPSAQAAMAPAHARRQPGYPFSSGNTIPVEPLHRAFHPTEDGKAAGCSHRFRAVPPCRQAFSGGRHSLNLAAGADKPAVESSSRPVPGSRAPQQQRRFYAPPCGALSPDRRQSVTIVPPEQPYPDEQPATVQIHITESPCGVAVSQQHFSLSDKLLFILQRAGFAHSRDLPQPVS